MLKTKDDGQISLDWVKNDDNNSKFPDANTRPTVIVLPGITGKGNESDSKMSYHLCLF